MSSVRFILGHAGTGKTTQIVQDIAKQLAADPIGEPIYLLVPDQATLLYERLLANASPTRGYVRLSVITFRALAEMLLADAGGTAIPEVTSLGRRILIGRLLRKFQPDLHFYRSTARQPGLANRLEELFSEIEYSSATLDDLQFLAADIEQQTPQSPLPGKLQDIRLLLREYDLLLGTDRLDQHRRLKLALKAAAESRTLPTAKLYVDAFHDFTRTERDLLQAIARTGCATTIALTLDPADAKPARRNTPLEDDHPFRATTHAFRRVDKAMRDVGLLPQIITCDTPQRFKTSDLLHVQKNLLLARPGQVKPTGDIRLIEAPDRRAEVDAAARQIIDWIASGMRLRDVLVLTRDINDYHRHIEASFTEHKLPFFIDRQQPAGHHPLVRTVRALVQVSLSQWHPDVVLELLKAGLLGFADDDIDAVENYVLAHQIHGEAGWAEQWRFKLRRFDDDETVELIREETDRINHVRAKLWHGVMPLLDCDDSNLCTATKWCQQICTALDRLEVNQTLAGRIGDAEKNNDLEAAARHREVWTEWVSLLDQLTQVLGEEPLSLREFAEVIDVALERFVLAITPPTIDQVLVGGVERTRSGPVKACVVLGLSEGMFPKRQDESAALGDDDRRILDRRNIELKASSRTRQFDEQFLAYLAFTRASHHLLITRPLTNEDGGTSLSPSLFWLQVKNLFKTLDVQSSQCSPRATCIATPRQLAEAIIAWRIDAGEATLESSRQLLGYAARSTRDDIKALRTVIRTADVYDNHAILSSSQAERLYRVPLQTSATRLETFAACPFKHFAQHGLRLSPRQKSRVTQLDLGLVYHRTLEKLVRHAITSRQDLAKKLPDLQQQLDLFSKEAADELRTELMLTPGRSAHLLEGMQRTLFDVMESQRLALSSGQFRPRHAEMTFGFNEQTPPLRIVSPAGHGVEMRGKIDRVDVTELVDRIAVSVIDYKLGARKADINRLYFGLNLQLVTYLLILSAVGTSIDDQRAVLPAAAFYVKLLRGIESVDHPTDASEPPDDLYFLNSAMKVRGLINADFIDAIDGRGSGSPSYSLPSLREPVKGLKRDVLDPETFEALIAWTRDKIGRLADQIIEGNISVYPYRLNTQTPCSTCDYRSVCRLDLAFNTYKQLDVDKERINTIVQEAPR